MNHDMHFLATKCTARSAWIPATVRPIRVGWYEVRYWASQRAVYSGIAVRYWDGRAWLFDQATGQCALGAHADDQWRGLASNPAGRVASTSGGSHDHP